MAKPKPADIPPKAVQATPDTITVTFACGNRITVTRSFLERLRMTIEADAHRGLVDLTQPNWAERYDMIGAWHRTAAELRSRVLN